MMYEIKIPEQCAGNAESVATACTGGCCLSHSEIRREPAPFCKDPNTNYIKNLSDYTNILFNVHYAL